MGLEGELLVQCKKLPCHQKRSILTTHRATLMLARARGPRQCATERALAKWYGLSFHARGWTADGAVIPPKHTKRRQIATPKDVHMYTVSTKHRIKVLYSPYQYMYDEAVRPHWPATIYSHNNSTKKSSEYLANLFPRNMRVVLRVIFSATVSSWYLRCRSR